jgi:isocitrate/isopropylmalate dehydrogenase
MMVEYLGYPEAGKAIEAAVRGAVSQNETTQDLGGALSTKQAGDAILRRLA